MASPFELEMAGQPGALAGLIAAYGGPATPLARLSALRLPPSDRAFVFVGMGSSLFASRPAVCRLLEMGVEAREADAGEYLHYLSGPPRPGLVPVLVSQSGESPEIRRIAEGLKGRTPFIAVTNDESSTLARSATAALPMLGGTEKSTTNRTYTNSVAVGLLLATWGAGRDPAEELPAMREAPAAMEDMLGDWRPRARALADFIGEPGHLDILGRGPAMATVGQGALILRELGHVRTAGMTAGNFRHGLIPSMGRGGTVLLLAPGGKTFSLTLGLARDIVSAGGKAVLVTDRDIPAEPGLVAVRHRPLGEYLAALPAIIPLQQLGILYAEGKGMEPGAGIAKVTPKE
jgi:glucosamine--fructose-6-phosphate aminotransferase (isomerizing)